MLLATYINRYFIECQLYFPFPLYGEYLSVNGNMLLEKS
jgi:hypothetical protein